ncbi:MAG TPA: hypothetical protein DGT21_10575 [Armatimonadetes bacterium]|nr:hypothetical protein [Armatimonadota bacterium]
MATCASSVLLLVAACAAQTGWQNGLAPTVMAGDAAPDPARVPEPPLGTDVEAISVHSVRPGTGGDTPVNAKGPKSPRPALDVAETQRVRPAVRKLLIIGNSITRHGPKADIGWPYECGMAATSEENDFAHLTLGHINAAQPAITAELSIGRVSDEAQMRGFEHLLPTDADLVIIELGDNYRGAASVDEFQKPYEQMVAAFTEAGVKRIFCVGTWGNGKLDPFIKAAAEKHGAAFVPIGHLFADPANRAVSEGHFTHSGVNWHPGDHGMKAIADTLWEQLGRLWEIKQ